MSSDGGPAVGRAGDAAAGAAPTGVLLFDKPAGITSHDVVAGVRRSLGRSVKVGHAGTLDPFATGLLLVLVGRATRVQRFLMALPKRYEVVARFGATSSTGDPEGEITATGRVPVGDLELPVGVIRQRPPAYSAVKVGGRRAYQLARAGVEFDLAEREVCVFGFDELWRSDQRRGFVIDCSSGTYVRSLIAGLGDAYCESLRRLAIGDFQVDAADPQRIVRLDDALGFMPAVVVGEEEGRSVRHGRALATGDGAVPPGPVRVVDPEGLVAIAEADGEGRLRPVVGLSG